MATESIGCIVDTVPYFKLESYDDDNVKTQLKIISHNMHGFRQGKPFLDSVLFASCADIIFLQEHWLSNSELCKLYNLSSN